MYLRNSNVYKSISLYPCFDDAYAYPQQCRISSDTWKWKIASFHREIKLFQFSGTGCCCCQWFHYTRHHKKHGPSRWNFGVSSIYNCYM